MNKDNPLINRLTAVVTLLVKKIPNARLAATTFEQLTQPGGSDLPPFQRVELQSGFDDEVYVHRGETHRIRIHIHNSKAEIFVIKKAPKFTKVPYVIKKFFKPEFTIKIT